MLQLSFVNFKKGSYILVEGNARSDRFYIIQSGKVQCYKNMDICPQTNEVFGPGDFVGVIPCMACQSQIENAIAVTDVVLIAVHREQYTELIKNNTTVAMKIIRVFAERTRSLNDTLAKLTLKSNIVSSAEMLFHIASYYEKMGKFNLAFYGYYQYLKECPHGVNLQEAKKRFILLRPNSHAVYCEPTNDNIRNYPQDTMIFSECQSGNDMFIIQSGEVTITKFVNDNEVVLAILKKGDFFGEMALLENKPRSASAIAHTQCVLMVVNKQNFNQMVSTQPQMISRLTTTFADRLWAMNRQLENTQIKDPVNKLLDMLALQIEKTKNPITDFMTWQFDITPQELATMCGIPKESTATILEQFTKDSHIRLNDNKIFVKNVSELLKFVSYVRGQTSQE